jgi:PAS domain S-box-containing protein/putative nucleotidyltransferase with HDIG domain
MALVHKSNPQQSSSYISIQKILRVTLILIAYIFIFVLLDWLTRRNQILYTVVTWYPPAGVGFALLLGLGWKYAPALAITSVISNLFIHKVALPLELIFIGAVLVALLYGIASVFLHRPLHFDPQLRSMRDVIYLIISSVIVAGISSVIAIFGDTSSEALSSTDKIIQSFTWWIRETVGIVVITPFLLIYVMPWVKQFSDGNLDVFRRGITFPPPPKNMVWHILTLLIALYLGFGVPALQPLNLEYLIAIPLIWMALEHGLKGVTFAILLLNVVITLAFPPSHFSQVGIAERQLLRLIISTLSLLVGAARTERMQIAAELSKSERRFRALVENSLEEVSLVSADGELVYESPTTQRPLGYPPGSFIGHNLFELFHPDDRAAASQLLEQVVKEAGAHREGLFRLRHQNGSWRWMEGVITNLLDEPAVQAVVINYRDVTERKQAEDTLRASEDRYRDLVEHSQDLICTHDLEGRILSVNPFAAQLLGYPSDVLVGANLRDFLAPESLELFDVYLYQLRKRGFAKGTMNVLTKQGEKRVWEYQNTLRTAGVAQPIVRGMARDVTERVQAEQALRDSEEHYRLLFESNPLPMWVYDLETLRFLAVNDAAVAHYGYGRDEFLSMTIREIRPPEELPGLLANLLAADSTMEKSGPWKHRKKDGTLIDVEIYAHEVTLAGKKARLVLANDITERKQSEEEIQTRTSELATLYKLSRDLAEAEDLPQILELVVSPAAETVHATFARIALWEGAKLVIRAAYSIRAVDYDLLDDCNFPVTSLPHCQRIMSQHDPVILRGNDPQMSKEERAALLLDNAQTICLIPLRSGDHQSKLNHSLGLLMLSETRSEPREAFTPAKIKLAQSIADQTAVAIRRMLLQEQTERRLQHLSALREIDKAISSSFGLHLSMSTLLTQVIDQLHVHAAAIWLVHSDTGMLEYSAGRGFQSRVYEQAKPLRLGEGYAGRAASEGRTIHISNLMEQRDNPRLMRALQVESFVSYYAVPLVARKDVKGVLEVFHRSPLEPDEEWLDFLHTLAGQAAIGIDNATLFDNMLRSNYQLTQAYNATIEGWSAALDLRDRETEGHTQRVTEMTLRLAKRMGFSKQELVHIRRGALLHDIGKMGVPDHILLKPGTLTDEEWAIMRKHPELAYQMLSPIQYLQEALDIPFCHHEKWDGTGYPRGLKREKIPFSALIFAVVDVWDALTSDRPYRLAWPKDRVLEHIRSLSGSHFDPRVVEVFLEMIP